MRKMREDIQEWNRKVWMLHILEAKLKKAFGNGLISKNKNKRIKKIIGMAWIRIWDLHPDQHPLAKELFKLNFG